MSERVGFIGLGIMGQGMARNLLRAGIDLTVWNRTASKAAALAREGATQAGSPAELAARCDVIILCVSDTPDVEAVLFGDNGVFYSVRSGSLVVDCSTISPIKTQQFADKFADKGVHMLDAPISGAPAISKRPDAWLNDNPIKGLLYGGKVSAFPACRARLTLGKQVLTKAFDPNARSVVFEATLPAGSIDVRANFADAEGRDVFTAYYVYIGRK